MEMYAQGDILFVKRDTLPGGDTTVISSGVIATGESSGHTHRIKPGQQAVLKAIAGALYLEALRESIIEHVVLPSETPTGDHDSIVLPPGNWEVRRQREWVPEGYRQIQD